MKHVQTHRKQANQSLLVRGAQNLRDAMYEQEWTTRRSTSLRHQSLKTPPLAGLKNYAYIYA
jgi:hypothetical protein